MSRAVGLDKLAFMLPVESCQFTSDFDAPLRLALASTAAEGKAGRPAPLYRDTAGRVVSGALAMLNTENYQLTIKPDRDGGKPLAFVQLSAGAFAESNLTPLGRDRCADVVLAVEHDLAERGALVPLEKCGKLTRIDIADNVQLSEPVENYGPIFAAVGARKTTSKLEFGGTGFVVGNKKRDRWQFAAYDKGAQMRAAGFAAVDCPANTLRPELRLLKGGVIRSRLGIATATLADLRGNWDALAAAHRETVERELFRYRAESLKPAPCDWGALLAAAGDSAQPWAAFVKLSALVPFVADVGLAKATDMALRAFAPDASTDAGRKQRDRIAQALEAAALRLALASVAPSGSPMLALYRELEEKLLAA